MRYVSVRCNMNTHTDRSLDKLLHRPTQAPSWMHDAEHSIGSATSASMHMQRPLHHTQHWPGQHLEHKASPSNISHQPQGTHLRGPLVRRAIKPGRQPLHAHAPVRVTDDDISACVPGMCNKILTFGLVNVRMATVTMWACRDCSNRMVMGWVYREEDGGRWRNRVDESY